MDLRVRSRDDRGIEIEADGRAVVLAPLAAANVTVRPSAGDEAGAAVQSRSLADLELGRTVRVERISPACRGVERRRLMDLGIVAGTEITPERRSLTGDPTVYVVRGTRIALRREQALTILVETVPDREQVAS
jgi:DtxR family Mn-dependent transcriptional regulator